MRARAGFALALILKRWSDNAADLADADSPRARQMARYFGEPVAERIRKDPRAITEEAERLFERVRETAGDVAYRGRSSRRGRGASPVRDAGPRRRQAGPRDPWTMTWTAGR